MIWVALVSSAIALLGVSLLAWRLERAEGRLRALERAVAGSQAQPGATPTAEGEEDLLWGDGWVDKARQAAGWN